MIPKNILITGASGLIGRELTHLLKGKGHKVSHLGRKQREGSVPSYVWDIQSQTLNTAALSGTDCIIHLAGAGVADKPWTEKRKQEIIESRTKSTALLHETLKKTKHNVHTVVCASAIGYYGFGLSDEVFTEESNPGNDFLASVVKAWEAEEDKIASLGIRLVKIRIGVVLSQEGGALAEMMKPIQWYVGAALGTGKQMMSWIHIRDLCSIFQKAIEDDSMSGAFNATAPNPVSNKEFTKALAKTLNKPLILPRVPAFALKMLLGEMADLILNGSHVSSKKIQVHGYEFLFPELKTALRDILGK